MAVVAELDLLVAQVGGRFVASALEAEGVVLLHLPGGLGVEEFVVVFGGSQEADADRSMPKRSMGFMPMASCSEAL